MLNFMRGIVRPFVTCLFSLTMSGLAILAMWKFGDYQLASAIVMAFIGLAGGAVGYYLGQRTNGGNPPGGTP